MKKLKKHIHDDSNGLDYVLVGDYYIPDLQLPEESRPIGRWGRMHREYLQEYCPDRYNELLLSGKLWTYSDYESYLPRCKEITEQLAEMIKDILNASRLQMQMEDVPVTTFSLAECVSELCEPYRLIAETNGLRFQIEIIEDMSVRLPENQLKKALSNILSNAVNYTEAERHIKVKLEKSVLSIQNECVPLSPDELQHIFEPFYRPNRARNPANGGNGLGLYIVKTILDKQGLQYCFTSMKSKTGMEFVIYF